MDEFFSPSWFAGVDCAFEAVWAGHLDYVVEWVTTNASWGEKERRDSELSEYVGASLFQGESSDETRLQE